MTPEELRRSIPPGTPPAPQTRPPQTGHPFDRLPPDLYRIRVELDRRLIASVVSAPVTRDLIVEIMEGERAALAELLAASRDSERSLGNLPLVVLTRGIGASQRCKDDHAALARQSKRGRHAVIDGSVHEIHLSHPEAVIAAIREVIAAGR